MSETVLAIRARGVHVLPEPRVGNVRDHPGGRAVADDVAPPGGLPDGPADVRAVRERAETGGQRGAAAPAARARAQLRVPGVARGAETRGCCRCRAPIVNSGVLSLPRMIAPAAFSRSTTRWSKSGTWSRSARQAIVVLTPLVWKQSFTPTGRPCRTPLASFRERAPVGRPRLVPRLVEAQGDEGVQHRIDALDTGDMRVHELQHACRPAVEQALLLDGGLKAKVHLRSSRITVDGTVSAGRFVSGVAGPTSPRAACLAGPRRNLVGRREYYSFDHRPVPMMRRTSGTADPTPRRSARAARSTSASTPGARSSRRAASAAEEPHVPGYAHRTSASRHGRSQTPVGDNLAVP